MVSPAPCWPGSVWPWRSADDAVTGCPACGAWRQTADESCPACGADGRTPVIEMVDESTETARRNTEDPLTGAASRRGDGFAALAFSAVLVGVAALFVVGGGSGGDGPEPVASPPTTTILDEDDLDDAVEASDQTSPAEDRLVGLPLSIGDWETADLLVVAGARATLQVVDMADGSVRALGAPETLRPVAPVAFDGLVAVVGEGSVLAVDLSGPNWVSLGPGDRVLPSTIDDRVWIRRSVADPAPTGARYEWREVDRAGVGYRTILRNQEVGFPTPEVVWGLAGDLFRLTESDRGAWRILVARASPVAIGRNDLVARQCVQVGSCDRIWIDRATSRSRGALWDDLADNIDVLHGAELSDDGRYAVYEDEGTVILNVANGEAVPNACTPGTAVAFTSGSELLACPTPDGVEVLDLRSSRSAGFALGSDWRDAGVVFVTTGSVPEEEN